MQYGKVNVLVDASWGSSAKGAASTRLVDVFNVENASSCNFPNAGHVVEAPDGFRMLFKCLPSAAGLRHFRANRAPKAVWIGPNSGFEALQLEKELAWTGYKPTEDLFIHDRAILVGQRHKDAEAPGGASSTEHISSTMSGAGAAFTEKAMRLPSVEQANDTMGLPVRDSMLGATDFALRVRDALERGETFLHEVSQGFALSVNHGTHFPQCTFRDCSAQQGFADLLIPPSLMGDVYLNVRSFSIRVGNNFRDGAQTGYSGDCWHDQVETTWEQVGVDAQMPPEEITKLAGNELSSVTRKLRRVFTPSWDYLRIAAKLNGATKLILNFPQYIHWSAYGVKGGNEVLATMHPSVRAYVDRMEDVTGLPVAMLGTSANHDDYVWLD